MPFPQYVKVKDRYCIHYVGPKDEYIDQLLQIRQAIEEDLPGIQVYLCCRAELSHLKERGHLFLESENYKDEVAYVRYLDGDRAVWRLITESYLPKTKEVFMQLFPNAC